MIGHLFLYPARVFRLLPLVSFLDGGPLHRFSLYEFLSLPRLKKRKGGEQRGGEGSKNLLRKKMGSQKVFGVLLRTFFLLILLKAEKSHLREKCFLASSSSPTLTLCDKRHRLQQFSGHCFVRVAMPAEVRLEGVLVKCDFKIEVSDGNTQAKLGGTLFDLQTKHSNFQGRISVQTSEKISETSFQIVQQKCGVNDLALLKDGKEIVSILFQRIAMICFHPPNLKIHPPI